MDRKIVQAQKRVLAELHQSAARAVREHIALASEGRFALARAKMRADAVVRAAVSNGVQVGILADWILAVAHPDRLEAADVLEYVWLAQGDEDDAALHVWLGHSRSTGPARIRHAVTHGALILQLDRLRAPIRETDFTLGEKADDVREDRASLYEFVDAEGLEEAERQLAAILAGSNTSAATRKKAEYYSIFCARVREQYATKHTITIANGEKIRTFGMRSRYERRHDTDGRVYSLGNGVIEKDDKGKENPRSIDTTGMPRALRPFFLQRFAHDYDQSNSQAVILLQMAETLTPEVDVTELRGYIHDRKALFDHVCETYGFGELGEEDRKELVKPLVLRLMFAGTLLGWQLENGLDPRTAPPCPRISRLEAELAELRRALFAHPEWSDWVARDRQRLREAQLRRPVGKRRSDDQIERSIFARIAQSQENVVLTAMRTYLAENRFKTLALVFDGLIVLHNRKRSPDMRDMAEYIKHYCGFDMCIEEKPMYKGPGAPWPELAL